MVLSNIPIINIIEVIGILIVSIRLTVIFRIIILIIVVVVVGVVVVVVVGVVVVKIIFSCSFLLIIHNTNNLVVMLFPYSPHQHLLLLKLWLLFL